jgi:dipeptidase D
MVLENLEPKLVWEIFENVLAATPRESKKEEKIRKKIISWVKERAQTENIVISSIMEDAAGNILIKKPSSPGMESYPAVLLQCHIDMVCVSDRPFDFDNEGIELEITKDGKWVEANKTSLGADNGIGVAIALAILFDKAEHGPLEVLLTIDEETGLTGALNLDVKKLGIKSKLLLNLDTEKTGIITIGCAGGIDILFNKKLNYLDDLTDADNYTLIELTVSGLLGGHSGGDIHLPRASANVLVGRCLAAINSEIEVFLVKWNGGSKRNAITRKSTAEFAVLKSQLADFKRIFNKEKKAIQTYYQTPNEKSEKFEPNLIIDWKTLENSKMPIINAEDSKIIISTATVIPHGVYRFSPSIKGAVETSLNLGVVTTNGSKISFHLLARSSNDKEREAFVRSVSLLGNLGKWDVKKDNPYPAWTPDPTSPLLQIVKKEYEQFLNKKAGVYTTHGGLETAFIGAKIPGIQMVSIGPTITGAHSPDEKVLIEEVGTFYDFLKILLGKIKME